MSGSSDDTRPGDLLWSPPADVSGTALGRFQAEVAAATGIDATDYRALWSWSVEQPGEFWSRLWDFYDVGPRPEGPALAPGWSMPEDVRWFEGATLNLAGYLLDRPRPDDAVAVLGLHEGGGRRELTWGELRRESRAFAATLRSWGVGPGDRVVGYLPHVPETVVAFLGTALVGALWSSVGQDYAPGAVLDRFGQLEPRVLVAGDGYHWAGRTIDRTGEIAEIRAGLPTIEHTVLVGNLGPDTARAADLDAHPWSTLTDLPADAAAAVTAQAVPFDHPLWVLYSSGTTGQPKGLVHGHGGVLLEELKAHGLHFDLGPDDRFLWYTSPSWVMWNIQITALLVGACVVAYDGAPTSPSPDALWEVVARERVTVFGVSPGFLQAGLAAGLEPGRDHDLSALRAMGSTGSPLSAGLHGWVRRHVGDLPLWSISGGTDVASAFIGGAPSLPVRAGVIPTPLLGVALEAWDGDGRPVVGQVGEMVITVPLPSMPVHLWRDPDHARYRDAYFSTFPGVWRHGDWITIDEGGAIVVHGRSDATLNRHGVRMGSADIYACLEDLPQIADALVVGVDEPDGGYWMPLFVVMAPGEELDDALRADIADRIRRRTTPRHVPDAVIAVRGVPHTRTGKRLEIPVKRLLAGAEVASVANPSSVDDATLLDDFAAVAAARAQERGAARG